MGVNTMRIVCEFLALRRGLVCSHLSSFHWNNLEANHLRPVIQVNVLTERVHS